MVLKEFKIRTEAGRSNGQNLDWTLLESGIIGRKKKLL